MGFFSWQTSSSPTVTSPRAHKSSKDVDAIELLCERLRESVQAEDLKGTLMALKGYLPRYHLVFMSMFVHAYIHTCVIGGG